MSVASKKNVLAYTLALTVVIGVLFTVRHRISFFNSSTITLSLDQLTEAQAIAQKHFESAKAGDANAMNNLGLMYAQGQIGKIDGSVNFAKAFSFFKMSADRGSSDAQNSIGSLFLSGAYGKKDDKIDLASAVEYFELSAAQDNLEAINNLASLYRAGSIGAIEGKPDYTKTAEIYKRQVDLGDSRGLVNLATMYVNGESVDKDIPRALELLESAVKLNSAAANRLIGDMHLSGLINKEPDYEKAVKYYNDAIAAGDSSAMVNLGSLYMSGKFGKIENRPNFEAALDLYRKAAQNNNPAGLTNIGAMYYSGIISEKDRDSIEIAKELWNQAAAMGDIGAKRNLEVLERRRLDQVASAETQAAPAAAPAPEQPAPVESEQAVPATSAASGTDMQANPNEHSTAPVEGSAAEPVATTQPSTQSRSATGGKYSKLSQASKIAKVDNSKVEKR